MSLPSAISPPAPRPSISWLRSSTVGSQPTCSPKPMMVPTPGNAAGPFASSSGQPPGSSLRPVPVAAPLSARLRPSAFNPINHPLPQRTAPTAKLGPLCLSNDFNTSMITLFAKPSRPSEPRISGAEDGFRSSTAPRFALLTPLLIRHPFLSSSSRSRDAAFRSFASWRS